MKPLLNLSQTALRQCRDILQHSGKQHLLLSLKSGGCSGFEYQFDTFNQLDLATERHHQEGLDIHVCQKSLFYLLGTHIDWKQDIMGAGFHFTNPNANQTCGCGSSFDPKRDPSQT